MDFLFIKGSGPHDVRMSKYIKCLVGLGHSVGYWGWSRDAKENTDTRLSYCRFILVGGGYGRKTMFRYPIWMLKLFLALIFTRQLIGKEIVAVNFDAALPTFLASLIRRFRFSYEILDEFAISYNFPKWMKGVIRTIDHLIIRRAKLLVHVDHNRVNYVSGPYIVIENCPEDYWHGGNRDYAGIGLTYAVVGCLGLGRGIKSICSFAKRFPNIRLLVVGEFFDKESEQLVCELKNADVYGYVEQSELFRMMEGCCGIFSLYDPSLEINRLAASNKVYDAMMMGVPVITNKEVINSAFIKEQGVGIVVDYDCDETWDQLGTDDFLARAARIGRKGRQLYLDEYQFDGMVAKRFIPAIEAQR